MPDRDRDISWPGWPAGSGGPTAAEVWLAELTNMTGHQVSGGPSAARELLAAGFVHRDGESPGPGFAGGATADRLAPGAGLAGLAADAWHGGLAGLSDDELVGLLCAYRRLGSWAMAGELAAVGALARRRPAPSLSQDGHLDEEVAAALTLTGRAAARLTGLAAGLARLPGTAAALEAGQIDGPRATVIADETSVLDDAAALAVEERVLGAAPGQTTGQLRAACRRAVLAADPQAAIRRRQRAEQDARVQAWLETSGTGALAGLGLPPAEMIAADQNIDAGARWLKARGVPGTLEQLRAKVFTAKLSGRLLETLLPAPAHPAPGTSTPDTAGLGTTGLDTTGLGTTGLDTTGLGTTGLGTTGLGTTGLGTTGLGATGPDTGTTASGQPDAGLPGGGPLGGGLPGGGLAGGGAALAGSVNLTVPLIAWLGLSDQPGEVAGLGALDAAACRDLSGLLARHPATRWCITLTGPGGRAVAHGCARAGPGPPSAGPAGAGHLAWLAEVRICGLEAGSGPCAHLRETRRYRPSESLRHLIKIRDRRCSFPGCRRPAARCDDDHTVAYDQGGRTCECNLSPLCRRHHRAKQAVGWQLTQPAPGTLTWTLPHGRSYTTTPGHYPG